jgi:hypothetical protein
MIVQWHPGNPPSAKMGNTPKDVRDNRDDSTVLKIGPNDAIL